MSEPRPPIPEETKREVRQRCHFGCVFCGLPVYEYDHIEEWAEVHSHDPSQITLLCPTHHAEKSRGLRTREQVSAANDSPFNRGRGITAPYGLHFGGAAAVSMNIGTDSFRSTSHLFPIVIDNWPVVAFIRDGSEIGLWLDLVDELNLPRVIIRNNELVMRSDAWDITFEGQRLTVRDDRGRVFLRIRFTPPASITIERARILKNGVWIEVFPSEVRIANSVRMSGNRWDGEMGFTVGYCPDFIQPIGFLRFHTPRFGSEVLGLLRGPALNADEEPDSGEDGSDVRGGA